MRPDDPASLRLFRAQTTVTTPLGAITKAGFLHKTPNSGGATNRRLGEFAVVYVYDGDGHYQDGNGVDHALVAGDLILVFPDLVHSYGPSWAGWAEYYICFTGPMFDLWHQMGLLDETRPVLHLEPIDHWLRQFTSVLGAGLTMGEAPAILEICRLQQVLAEALVGGPRGAAPSDDMRWANRACALLEADLSDQPNLEQVAEQMGTSYASFRRRFTQVVGMPPGRYRSERVIERACQLMQQTGLTDKQIADELGFCDEFHFSRRFKQMTGQPPSRYRAALP